MSTQSYTTDRQTIGQHTTSPSRKRRGVLVAWAAAVAATGALLTVALWPAQSSTTPAGNVAPTSTSVPSQPSANPAVPSRPAVNPAVPSRPAVNPAVPSQPAANPAGPVTPSTHGNGASAG